MFEAVDSPWRVPYDGSFRVAEAPTRIEGRPKKKQSKADLAEAVRQLDALQEVLYAQDHHAVLLVFQAMDAAGKDGTIRAVLTGVNPAGCQVFSFKQPSSLELDHDFLWRTARRLPERGRIGIFNRSYYEEVLVARVIPGILQTQRLPDLSAAPDEAALRSLFAERYASIRDHELHLARNGTVILKFFLHVSREKQRSRFLARIDDPAKNWKFSHGDLDGRARWAAYQSAYQQALAETSRPWAPWYAIPADNKPAMQHAVADLVVRSLQTLDLRPPTLPPRELARLAEARERLLAEGD